MIKLLPFIYNDGGRKYAGFKPSGDCVIRANLRKVSRNKRADHPFLKSLINYKTWKNHSPLHTFPHTWT